MRKHAGRSCRAAPSAGDRTRLSGAAVERATLRDFDELLALMDRSFRYQNPQHIPFRKLLPDLYPRTDEAAACHRVIRRNGRPVASLGIYPLDLQMGRVRLRVGGIGAVCTDPQHRGRGYMSCLVQAAKREMTNEGYALSWLSGDRTRYAHFGWEKAGTAPHVAISDRGLGRPSPAWEGAPFHPGRDDPADILAARRQLAWKGLADEQTLLAKFRRPHVEVWQARRHGAFAYAVFQCRDRRIVEWGGDPEGVHALAAWRIAAQGVWWAALPPERDAYFDVFLARAEDVAYRLDNLAVLDLPNLLRAYADVLASRWPARRALRLIMRTGHGRSVATVRGQGVVVAGGRAELDLELDEREMARFLFGPLRPSVQVGLPAHAQWLDQVFPLPFYLPYLWRV